MCSPHLTRVCFWSQRFSGKGECFLFEQTGGFTKESGGSGCSADVWFCWSRFPTSPSNSSSVLAWLWKLTLVVTDVWGVCGRIEAAALSVALLFSSSLKEGVCVLGAIANVRKILSSRSQLLLRSNFRKESCPEPKSWAFAQDTWTLT